jgi:hypothetical protein
MRFLLPAIGIAIFDRDRDRTPDPFFPKARRCSGRKPGHPSPRASYKQGCEDAPGARGTSSVTGAVASWSDSLPLRYADQLGTEASKNVSYFIKSTRHPELSRGETPMIKSPIWASVGSSTASRSSRSVGGRVPITPVPPPIFERIIVPEEGTNKCSPSETKNKSMAPSTGHKLCTRSMASAISGSAACGSSALICISIASRR